MNSILSNITKKKKYLCYLFELTNHVSIPHFFPEKKFHFFFARRAGTPALGRRWQIGVGSRFVGGCWRRGFWGGIWSWMALF